MSHKIHADHLRKSLLARNEGETFRRILDSLSDEKLIRLDAEHHKFKLKHFAVQRELALIVTPEMREAAFRKTQRRRSFIQ